MGNKEVAIARHTMFYKIFFTKHKEFLEEMIDIKYVSLLKGYEKLRVYYSSYAYYLKEDDIDTYLREMLSNKVDSLENNKEYQTLKKKVLNNNMGKLGLDYKELIEHNKQYIGILREILQVFEIFGNRFAPSDIFPKLTENIRDYDRSIVYVIYDNFYESLFNVHGKVHDKLMKFNILDFEEAIKLLMVFFYGYAYYIQNDTKKEIVDGLDELFEYYNNEDFLMAYYNLLQGYVDNMGKVQEYTKELFNKCLNIFELINSDLPKSNLFPKKAEKIIIDTTLI